MANVLITGGTGLIGQALVAQLKRHHHDVTVLTRHVAKAEKVFDFDVVIVDDLYQIDDDIYFDVIVNLAGEPIADKRWSEAQKQRIYQSRVDSTHHLVKWMKTRLMMPSVLISGSAVGWYGDGKNSLLTEQSGFHDEYTHQLCDAWEQAALSAKQLGCRVCIMRTGLVVSSEGGFLKKMLPSFKLCLGGPLSNGQQYMPWIHIDDMVAAILFLAFSKNKNELSGIYNFTAPKPVTNKEFSQTLASVLSKPCLFFVPALVLKLMLGEMSRLVLTGQNAIPERLQQAGFEFTYHTLKPALEDVLGKRANG
ncbi:TIGR01777 family protein [Thalassotalea sp. LPB0316]|uniref:TIGR01777 family oxidoreductase n=1 Tax=Thalassotalea sp. LPB0316 TaxID=2769490 RepID=UPI0018676E25|nr:TIGR01777 family oxidoreductase [Thalassotalea sp. LPB0316]QOL24673.1 TIGR01777 family protein [Thalassotalea sp. LPB0316]